MTQHPIPVFVLGSGRSGTTITATLMNHLPGIHIAKETGFIGQHLTRLINANSQADLAALIPEINSWLEINLWEHTGNVADFQRFCSKYDIQGARALIYYIWQLDSPTPWNELSFIGDNTPLYVMAIPAIQQLFPEARYIHVVRDPRDVVCSIRKMRFGADELVTAAMEWHLYLGCWMTAERLVSPDQRMECRYEDLCMDPEQTFARLARFVDRSEADAKGALALHASPGAKPKTGFENVAAASHHTRINEPLSPSRVGRYRTELTAAQIQAVEEIAQYGMLAYGYTPSKWHVHPLMREDRMRLVRAMILDVANRCFKRLRGKLTLGRRI